MLPLISMMEGDENILNTFYLQMEIHINVKETEFCLETQ